MTLAQLKGVIDASDKLNARTAIVHLNNLTAAIGAALSKEGGNHLKKWGKELEKQSK